MYKVILLGIFSLTLFCYLIYRSKHRTFFQHASKIPTVPAGFIRRIKSLIGANQEELFQVLKETICPGPSPRKAWLGPLMFVFVDDPDQVNQYLNSPYGIDKPKIYSVLGLDKGLFVSNGALWKAHRKLLDPSFNAKVLSSFNPIFNEKSKLLIKKLEDELDAEEFNIFSYFISFGLDNILRTSTGVDKKIMEEKNNKYVNDCTIGVNIFASKIVKFWLQLKPIMRMSNLYELEQKHILNGMFKMAHDLIQEKEENIRNNNDVKYKSEKPQIFIDQLFKKRNEFSFDEMADEINTIILAGFETIATLSSTVVLLAALYPDVQEKIFEELKTVFNSVDEEVTDRKLQELSYLDQVVNESARYWTTLPYIARSLSTDIEIGSKIVPSGSIICVPIILLHSNKEIWGEDADKFIPERFSSERLTDTQRKAFMPFGRGPRICIGNKYAIKSIKIALSHFFRNYKSSTNVKEENLTFEYTVFIKLVQGYMVKISKREF
ncbi:CLUMA_CG012623, isoform A [Clunio marinus]|uniref:CLUMA_CG012623, isoform A n=1 Tax=Clunio marinus TaxID=568069 RepID=A0A1J1IG58_9DIPT|nr:CLUMA_CG012623, isoform A [Clunio marinus]